MKLTLSSAIIISLSLLIGISQGEVIRLETGNLIQGKIILETKAIVKVTDAASGKEVTLNRAEIANIVDDRVFEGGINLKDLKKLKSAD